MAKKLETLKFQLKVCEDRLRKIPTNNFILNSEISSLIEEYEKIQQQIKDLEDTTNGNEST